MTTQEHNAQEKTSPFAAVTTAKVAEELGLLLREYLRQQTVRPAKQLLRWVLYGLVGGVLLLAGIALLTLAGLRALQTETGTLFGGNLSWLPYVISIGGVGILLSLAIWGMKRKPTGAPQAEDSKS